MIDSLVSLKNNQVVNTSGDYEINGDTDITINSDIAVNIYDFSVGSNVKVNILDNAVVNYYVFKSKNSKRLFEVNGKLNVISVNLEENKETLEINLNTVNATVEVKNLVISNGLNQEYVQMARHNSTTTFSNIENVGISFDGGNITFDTTGKIEKGMNKSKCSQLSRGVVMDNKSTVTAKPILLIDEYDCFANHGASIGKMSDDDLFYLMSRGLTKDEAFLLILQGIVRPFINAIPNELLRNEIEESVNKLILR